MKIIKTYNWSRRDFTFDAECEHCGNVQERISGYDDRHFHDNVVPRMKCKACGEVSPEDAPRPATRYPADMVV